MKLAKMTSRARFALKKSIAHWRRMATGKRLPGEAPTSEHCFLCSFYIDNPGCRGCPVVKRTGHSNCRETPYQDAYAAYKHYGTRSPRFKAAAQKELDFLESLLFETPPPDVVVSPVVSRFIKARYQENKIGQVLELRFVHGNSDQIETITKASAKTLFQTLKKRFTR